MTNKVHDAVEHFETALQALKEKEDLEDNGLSAPNMANWVLQNCDEWCDGDSSVGVPPCRFFRESDTGESWCSLKKYLDQKKKEDNMDKQDKPLSEWTLAECKRYCDEQSEYAGMYAETCQDTKGGCLLF